MRWDAGDLAVAWSPSLLFDCRAAAGELQTIAFAKTTKAHPQACGARLNCHFIASLLRVAPTDAIISTATPQ
jgi:hypothetical protein